MNAMELLCEGMADKNVCPTGVVPRALGNRENVEEALAASRKAVRERTSLFPASSS
jgi:hypothetical protein